MRDFINFIQNNLFLNTLQRMNSYKLEFKLRILLLLFAFAIIIATLWMANNLTKQLAEEERKRMELLSSAYEQISNATDQQEITFFLNVILQNKTIPLILTDDKFNISADRNFDSLRKEQDSTYLPSELKLMRANKDSIPIYFQGKPYQYVFYKESKLLVQLRYFPVVLLIIISIFLLIAYWAFFASQKSLQHQLWVGMAKETAHQLATPISSLNAWLEHLDLKTENNPAANALIPEMSKDIERLEVITQRFSKIGGKPELVESDLVEHVNITFNYMKRRAPSKIQFELINNLSTTKVKMSPPLIDWVFENLIRNAIDAMSGKGFVKVVLSEGNKYIKIDVMDSGKGIPADNFNDVFKPGFSTKKRGWGLGLSLCKRIVEEYHKGKIFVKESEMGKGTTFRIMLNK